MKTKRFFIFAACCLLALTLAGCGNGRVESTVSRLGDDISNTVSRVESALDPDDNISSGFPDEDEISSMPDYSSSQGGGINSGDNDITNGTESDPESDIGNDSSDFESGTESEVSESTKNL